MENLAPEYILDTFVIRIKKCMEMYPNCNIDTPCIQKELDRIKTINSGVIPERIIKIIKKNT